MRIERKLSAAVALIVFAGCDTDVQNPGPVQDDFLNDTLAQPAIVNGMGRALSESLNYLAYTSAAVTREIHPSGSTGSFGITARWQSGELSRDDDGLDTHWELGQQARWLAENGVTRIEPDPMEPELLAQAYLYAGYANRLLGETQCEAVIDGGPAEAYTVYFDRAEDWFSKAATAGEGDIRTAAIAGRASVLADLGQWSEAATEAAQVPSDFEYELPYQDVGSDAQRNRIEWASHAEPYRAHTQWNTWIGEYHDGTVDPRVPYLVTEEVGDAAIECCGRVPWWPQQLYTTPDAAITLSSGAEMRLIEAERSLIDGDVAAAVVKINELRNAAGVDPVTATTVEEAWTALMRERGIVLWLEGRRMFDRRRWAEAGRPGTLHPLELPSGAIEEGSHLVQQDLCFPIAPTEQDTNPNVS
ncbi:MAG: RagB/SusD family nutrient uptake outer membrane protein [Longimicrobiales bacterium]